MNRPYRVDNIASSNPWAATQGRPYDVTNRSPAQAKPAHGKDERNGDPRNVIYRQCGTVFKIVGYEVYIDSLSPFQVTKHSSAFTPADGLGADHG